MRASIIIPSHYPGAKLEETISALLPEKEHISEIIIATGREIEEEQNRRFLMKFSSQLDIHFIKHQKPGRAANRNAGGRVTHGDLLVFLDDDMLAEKDLIKNHLRHHTDSPGSIMVGNAYRNPASAKDDFARFLVRVEEAWKNKIKGNWEVNYDNYVFTAANLSMPKEIFLKMGGFDERFADGEDFDFAMRALKNNVPIYYYDDLIAWHNDRTDIKTFINRQKEYASGKKAIFKVHPEYLTYFPEMNPLPANKFKKFMATLFKAGVTWFVSAGTPLFSVLPFALKVKLYHIAIALNSF